MTGAIRKLVVISGKGGTGKTSITASFAALAGDSVLADCDVDAADLHLVLEPEVRRREVFLSGNEAVIRSERCSGCGRCEEVCRFDAVQSMKSIGAGGVAEAPAAAAAATENTAPYRVDPIACDGCGVCVHFCPENAIDFPERECGEWFVSDTRYGPMVHARLGVAAKNSGRLVSTVRKEAGKLAEDSDRDLILVDGPPGIGCPVIASITGASEVLVVTEPSIAGEHDAERVLELCRHFHVPASVCINKWDVNPELCEQIEECAYRGGARIAGRISYDPLVIQAQIQRKTPVEIDCVAAGEIRMIWNQLAEDYNRTPLRR